MKARLLVVDDNKALVDLVKKYFEEKKDIEVVKVAYDGEEATKIIKDNQDSFDIILLDLIMPRKDGIYVLDYMKENNIRKDVIVISSYDGEDTIKEVSEYGVKYYALKLFDFSDLEKKIIKIINTDNNTKLVHELGGKKIQLAITKLLHELGVPSHIKGYELIRAAIAMIFENPGLVGGITKELYPSLSIKFKTSVQRVERAIRHAIEVSWMRGDLELIEEIFGNSVDINKSKPTNSEFLVTLADKLRLDLMDNY